MHVQKNMAGCLKKLRLQASYINPLYTDAVQSGCLLSSHIMYHWHTVTPLALPDLQVVVPRSLRPTILEQLHNEGGHLGTHKTAEKLRERYYWPDYMTDVEKWVKECEQCQHRNSHSQKAHAPLDTIQAEYPFQKISWDIMGPPPVSAKGHKYILVVTDLFTKWVEAFPLCSTESTTLATVPR